MDKTTGLEYLPLEVLEYIASYLSLKDIIACCATCSLIRHAFNGDLVWKRRCNLEFVDYLNHSESLIEPSVEWSEVTDNKLSTLSPLSTWRKNYMLQIRLFQNWRKGRFVKKEIEFGSSGIDGSIRVRFYQNDFIFLYKNSMVTRREENVIWRESQFLHSILNLDLNVNMSCCSPILDEVVYVDKYNIVGNKLMVSTGNLVKIYDICLSCSSPISLFYAFYFHLSEEYNNYLFLRLTGEPGFSSPEPVIFSIRSIVCGNFFVGVVACEENIYIWNIQTGKRVAKENSPLNNIDDMYLVTSDEEANHFIFKLTLPGNIHRYHYYGYNLTKLEFSSFTLNNNNCDIIILSGKFVIGVKDQLLFSYNYETSEKLAVRECKYNILITSVIVVGRNLLCGTADSTIFVMDPSNLNIINSVKLGFILYSLKSICNQFVMIQYRTYNTEVWEIGKNVKPFFKFPCDVSFAAINQHCTKIALEKDNKIIILTFW